MLTMLTDSNQEGVHYIICVGQSNEVMSYDEDCLGFGGLPRENAKVHTQIVLLHITNLECDVA